jgi:hypothetical protein
MSRATLVDMQPEEETADTLENEEPVETQRRLFRFTR